MTGEIVQCVKDMEESVDEYFNRYSNNTVAYSIWTG